MRSILVDTNAYVAFKQGIPDAVAVIQHAPTIGINSVVFGELLCGFARGRRKVVNRRELERFLNSPRVVLLSITKHTAECYATVYLGLKQKGKPIPTNDMWIAASAIQHELAAFTYDRHLTYVDGLIVGSVLADFTGDVDGNQFP